MLDEEKGHAEETQDDMFELLEADAEGSETPPGGETTGEGTEESGEKEPPWKRVRSDLYRRQSELEKTLKTENQQLQQQLSQLGGMLQGFLANQQKGGGGSPPERSDSDLTPEKEEQYWQQRPGEIARYLIKQEMAKERQKLRSDILQEVNQSSTRATTMRRLHHDFPELRSDFHPWTQKANEIYNELAGEFGGSGAIPQGSELELTLVQAAAERAARLFPDLREESSRSNRRQQSVRETQMASNGSLTPGRPGPKRKPAPEVEMTEQDLEIARRWKVNLKDPEVAKRIAESKSEFAKMRLAPRFPTQQEED